MTFSLSEKAGHKLYRGNGSGKKIMTTIKNKELGKTFSCDIDGTLLLT